MLRIPAQRRSTSFILWTSPNQGSLVAKDTARMNWNKGFSISQTWVANKNGLLSHPPPYSLLRQKCRGGEKTLSQLAWIQIKTQTLKTRKVKLRRKRKLFIITHWSSKWNLNLIRTPVILHSVSHTPTPKLSKIWSHLRVSLLNQIKRKPACSKPH